VWVPQAVFLLRPVCAPTLITLSLVTGSARRTVFPIAPLAISGDTSFKEIFFEVRLNDVESA
jgi:hypothetical protein